ncbi:MAG: hypothetical protein EPO08_16245 [Rhodospirillaceae bacterium]|nr:MAG: hypothetical protein EPO08_16245 [Rhodospirillaceae bacterium]
MLHPVRSIVMAVDATSVDSISAKSSDWNVSLPIATGHHKDIELAADFDHIVVPSPELSKAQRAMAADAHVIGPISQALHSYQMTPVQIISVRNYIGQYGEDTKIVDAGSYKGASVFGIKDAKSGEFIGQIEVRAGANGEVVINKMTAAEFDTKKKIEFTIPGKASDEDAQKVLGGSAAHSVFTNEEKKNALDVVMPGFVNIEGHADYGSAREATAHFYPDGSGYEYGLATKIASAQGEAKVNFGASVGAGARGPEVEGFVNYFGKPEADENAKFTRSVLGGTVDMHATLAEVQAKYGCESNKPCEIKGAIGGLGVGAGGGLAFSPHVDIPVRPANQIEDGGIATPPPPPPPPPPDEQKEYDDAVKSGDSTKLESFVEKHPESPLAETADDQIDYHVTEDPAQPMPVAGY